MSVSTNSAPANAAKLRNDQKQAVAKARARQGQAVAHGQAKQRARRAGK